MVVTIGARLGWQLAKACLQHRDRLGGIEKAVRIPSRRRRQLGVTATRGFCRWDRRWRIARLTTALPPRRQAARAIKFYRQDGPCWDPVRNRPPMRETLMVGRAPSALSGKKSVPRICLADTKVAISAIQLAVNQIVPEYPRI